MKEDLKNVFLMGLGAMSMTSEKAKDMKEELIAKGEKLLDSGKVANEELKHNIKEAVKNNVTVEVVKEDLTAEELALQIKSLSKKDREKLEKLIRPKKDTK